MRHRHQRHRMLAVNWHCCSVGAKKYATCFVERVAYGYEIPSEIFSLKSVRLVRFPADSTRSSGPQI